MRLGVWTEAHYGKDQADYERWEGSRGWFSQPNLFDKPIVRYDFDDSSEFDGNAYTKGGWVLDMLRYQLGDDGFYRGLKRYLEVNRDRKSTRLNSSHSQISYAVFCLKKKNQ